MTLYFVQLETRDHTYQYEVLTADHDAVGHARSALGKLIGASEAAIAHMGNVSRIGSDPEAQEVRVTLTMKRDHQTGERQHYA